ncbi:MAG: hypothetical protein Kow0059_20220 [Candidatus Sumerlaeia bacterium]
MSRSDKRQIAPAVDDRHEATGGGRHGGVHPPAHSHAAAHAPVPYGVFVLVWLALVIFTGLTVAVAGVHLAWLSVPVALAIACAKATLVLLYFMHIRYEDRLFVMFLGIAFATITVILVLTFSDVIFRF